MFLVRGPRLTVLCLEPAPGKNGEKMENIKNSASCACEKQSLASAEWVSLCPAMHFLFLPVGVGALAERIKFMVLLNSIFPFCSCHRSTAGAVQATQMQSTSCSVVLGRSMQSPLFQELWLQE